MTDWSDPSYDILADLAAWAQTPPEGRGNIIMQIPKRFRARIETDASALGFDQVEAYIDHTLAGRVFSMSRPVKVVWT